MKFWEEAAVIVQSEVRDVVEAVVEIREAVSKGFSILDGTEVEVDFDDRRRSGVDILDELVQV